MRSLVIVGVVLGLAYGQGFPRDTPEVEAARNAFLAEYNRLAKLAAMAPDIHIYHRDPEPRDPTNPAAARPINFPAFNSFSFSANLGSDQQFVPGPDIFHGAGHMSRHLAGHTVPAAPRPAPQPTPQPAARLPVQTHRLRVTEAPLFRVSDVPTFSFDSTPVQRWTGPLADEVPAGLGGHVMETPSVVAAKAAHFRAIAEAKKHAARFSKKM